jgi:DNA-3-methyladenine glycosylase I
LPVVAEMGVEPGPDGTPRCWWCLGAPELLAYHDDQWGRPLHGDRELFEMLTLESFQSGLSWLTILRKRGGFRRAFDDWDVERIAA